ncbi:amino acid ABC transporter substrate-binding protein [Halobacillus litoralis]|uniref:amino acid ABC transporter substrate-binding protein n=1 Tax=Halobacillus litoralis TaxID=45668 RepID=UPI00136D0FEA|nr:amino acid ABC transporter substrate-binding protein [Halobacillus litoralis]MYL37425.1 transporter substrate-binding domain-containing protein [Halobacillus litoralis]
MKKLTWLFSIGFLVLVLAACGTSEDESQSASEGGESSETEADGEENLLEEIKANGELVIGTEGTYRPYTFHDDNDELTGFDVEIAREVADRLGVEAKFNETKWDSMFAGLNAGRFDMVANQVGIREDRQEKYDFSNPYIQTSAVVVTNENNDSIQSFEDLEGVNTAQSLTSNYRDIAEANNAEITGVEGFNESMQMIASNRIEATVNDRLSVLDYMQQRPEAPVKIAARADEASESGLLFRKGNEELVDAVNNALEEMKEDGTYLEISEKWFGEDVSK